jgi:N-hydroxyarylamine O-acetyltransferase
MIDIASYFHRINYSGDRRVCPKVLTQLHQSHVLTIPFETLDIHLDPLQNLQGNSPISLEDDTLIKKLVLEERGGYCYEMNGLFGRCLEALHFKVTYLSARVVYGIPKEKQPIPRMHMLLKVDIGGKPWLADVGFGGNGLLEPIPLLPNIVYNQAVGDFRLTVEHKKYTLWTEIKHVWEALYEFTLEEFLFVDFQPINFYQSLSPQAPFTNRILCTKPTESGGRIILDGKTLKIREREGIQSPPPEILNTPEKYHEKLKQYFQIDIPVERLRTLKLKATGERLF